MADITNNININVTGNADEQLNKIKGGLEGLEGSQTKITQSTKNLTKETGNLNKGLLQNGGAMGLLSAATGGLAMDFKDAVEAIDLTGTSLKGLRGAIIATGIGALAIILLELVTNWDKWSGAISGSTKQMEELNQQLTITKAINKEINDENSREIALAEARGETQQQILDRKIAQQEEYNQGLRDEYDLALQQYILDGDRSLEAQNKINQLRDEVGEKIRAYQLDIDITREQIKRQKIQDETNRKLKIQKETLEAQKRAQDDLNKSLTEAEKGITTLKSINELLRGITTVDLTSEYSKWKQLTDAYYNTRDAIVAVSRESVKIVSFGNLTAEQEQRLQNISKELVYYQDNFKIINQLIERQKDYTKVKEMTKDATLAESIEIDILTMKYDQLSNALYDYERADFTANKVDTSTERLIRINKLLDQRLEIIRRNAELSRTDAQTTKAQLENDIKLLQDRNQEILNTPADTTSGKFKDMAEVIARVEKDRLEGSVTTITEYEDRIVREYFDNIDKVDNYRNQSRQAQRDLDKSDADEGLALNKAILDAKLEQERVYLELKLEAQENYYNAVQTLQSEVYSLLDQLQNAQIIGDRHVRNTLLVAQKGAEIAQVVMNTVKENSKLKSQATLYKVNAGLNFGLAASLAAVDPVAAAAYGAAGSNYAAGAAASLAAIPVNWKIAGASIASILATTITSWSKGDSGGGSGGVGGGGGPQAQFNIVGSSGTNQLAAGIAASQNAPVNAYVVGSDMSTQQALDRNRITNATFL
jgi:hypothetical protein